jgi:hypothetical protein
VSTNNTAMLSVVTTTGVQGATRTNNQGNIYWEPQTNSQPEWD